MPCNVKSNVSSHSINGGRIDGDTRARWHQKRWPTARRRRRGLYSSLSASSRRSAHDIPRVWISSTSTTTTTTTRISCRIRRFLGLPFLLFLLPSPSLPPPRCGPPLCPKSTRLSFLFLLARERKIMPMRGLRLLHYVYNWTVERNICICIECMRDAWLRVRGVTSRVEPVRMRMYVRILIHHTNVYTRICACVRTLADTCGNFFDPVIPHFRRQRLLPCALIVSVSRQFCFSQTSPSVVSVRSIHDNKR